VDYGRIAGMLDKTFAWALSRTFSREEAEELTQEILLQALESISGLRDESKFAAWFWRLADITLKVFKRGRAKTRSVMSFDEAVTQPTKTSIQMNFLVFKKRINSYAPENSGKFAVAVSEKLFPKHLKETTERNGFHVFVALFKAVAADWIRSGRIRIPAGAVCDVLIMW
jgi:hypothetical protein